MKTYMRALDSGEAYKVCSILREAVLHLEAYPNDHYGQEIAKRIREIFFHLGINPEEL
jgi:hypothetical protein